jgi:hypothetical protein
MIDQHGSQGPQLPSSFIRDAFNVISLAYAMFRAWIATSALVYHLKRKFKRNPK